VNNGSLRSCRVGQRKVKKPPCNLAERGVTIISESEGDVDRSLPDLRIIDPRSTATTLTLCAEWDVFGSRLSWTL
jgi:hypothetical protein